MEKDNKYSWQKESNNINYITHSPYILLFKRIVFLGFGNLKNEYTIVFLRLSFVRMFQQQTPSVSDREGRLNLKIPKAVSSSSVW